MKRFVSLLFLCMAFTFAMSQRLNVENFTIVPHDLTGKTHPRNDNNGQPCALVKVQLARPGATFQGNVMGDTPYSQSEYFVYMMKGSKMLQVKLEGYLPVMIDFEKDWGIAGVEPLMTYVLSIALPNVVGQSVDNGKTYFSLTVTPKSASVRVDDDLVALEDGTWFKQLDRGVHRYKIEAAGYETKEETFTLGAERKSLQVSLVSTMATLTVKCLTPGADIFIDEKKRGSNSTWTGPLVPNSYVIEARKEGYYSQQQSVELSAKQNRTIELPALIARVGQLDVAYRPLDSEVWIDGKKVGLSPDVFKNLVVGVHSVEIRKEGYRSETKSVTIAEGQTATLSGSLVDNQTFKVNGVSFTMIHVEGGTFTMGCSNIQDKDAGDDESPVHQVTLSNYSIGETEVTQELWDAVMESNPSFFKGSKRPVEQVSWNDCQDFILKLNAATGRTFRLPTEAEWEYAARGGQKSESFMYSGSNKVDDVAWYYKNSYGESHDVARRNANELGLYDMSGNVLEWCSDWYDKNYYVNSSQTNPQGPQNGQYRVFRGGSWFDYARFCRTSIRLSDHPGYHCSYLGLRLVLPE